MDDRLQPTATEINLLWLNETIDETFMTIFPPAKSNAIFTRIVKWASMWPSVVLWYDSDNGDNLIYHLIDMTVTLFAPYPNIKLKDIREVSIIREPNGIFSSSNPSHFFKEDILKLMLAYSALVYARKPTYFIFSSLYVEPIHPGILLDRRAKALVEQFGFAFGVNGFLFTAFEPMLSFFIFSNHQRNAWIHIVKKKIIDLNIARFKHLYRDGVWNGAIPINRKIILDPLILRDLINVIKYYYSRKDWADEEIPDDDYDAPFGVSTNQDVVLSSFSSVVTDTDGQFMKSGYENRNTVLLIPKVLVKFKYGQPKESDHLNGLNPKNIGLYVKEELRKANEVDKAFSPELLFLVIRNNYEELARLIVDSLSVEQLAIACSEDNKVFRTSVLDMVLMAPFQIIFTDERSTVLFFILEKLGNSEKALELLLNALIKIPLTFISSYKPIEVMMKEKRFERLPMYIEVLHRLCSCLFASKGRDEKFEPLDNETIDFVVKQMLPKIASRDPLNVFDMLKADLLVLNATKRRCYPVINYISERGGSDAFTAVDSIGMFPLLYLCRFPDDFEELEIVFHANRDMINARDDRKETVAHQAVLYNNIGALKLVISYAAKSKTTPGTPLVFKMLNNQGDTPLMVATQEEVPFETFKFLWETFPDTDIYYGKSVATRAATNGNIQVIKYLVETQRADRSVMAMIRRDYVRMRQDTTHIDVEYYLMSLQKKKEEDSSDDDD